MLVIRHEQFAALAQARQEPLVNGLCQEIRSRYSQRVGWLSDQALRRRIHDGLRRADNHGLHASDHKIRFVLLMFAVAPHFDRHPAFATILADRALPADARMRSLLRNATREDWRQAARLTHPGALKGSPQ